MLPLSLLHTAAGHPLLVELKNGETFNGHLVSCDNFMNLTLREVIQTSPDGDRFWRLPECYIRGNTIKYLNVPEEIVDMVKEEEGRQRTAVAAVEDEVDRIEDAAAVWVAIEHDHSSSAVISSLFSKQAYSSYHQYLQLSTSAPLKWKKKRERKKTKLLCKDDRRWMWRSREKIYIQ
ncbi:hypothetical protein VTP01DRAFT_8283 [Rhizomucor pusillus]|uniref:uncharacterized protein n=1 Tax=Rhizomucor pusillus TaxID=4840 RepID=UPI003743FADE